MIKVEFTVGTVIRLLREQKKMGQKDFGIHKVSQSKIESGVIRNPKPETLRAIAERLGVTVEEIHDCVSILNGALKAAEPVDSEHRRLGKMLAELLDAGGDRRIAIKKNIESLHREHSEELAEIAKKAQAG